MSVCRVICLVGGAFTFGLLAAGAVGCSGDDTNPAAPVADSGSDGTTGPGQDGAAADANGSSSDAGTTTDAGRDSSCDKQPSLHPAGSGGPYCPFIDGGGEGANCAAGQLCCIDEASGLENGSCQTVSACPAQTAFFFQCSGPSNCNLASGATGDGGADGGDAGDASVEDAGAPMVCCGFGPTPTVTPSCPAYDLESDLSATACATACSGIGDGGSNALIICDTATGECPGGMTCTPFRARGSDLGFCM